ncbi:hypothetical protein GIB67_010507 [Kingdonia uniflora]|uniref:Uncharacterized protein n=1 Tax=Kingdonia uniflora TaxID=39325 RepID=A0A7J7MAL8_9MAGN|nr:hypothetical protein GIB67_010507 [Kingdonia uniflora]
MKLQFGKMIIQMKPIYACLILGPHVFPITNELLFVDPEHMTNFKLRRFPKKKNSYGLKEIVYALKYAKLEDIMRNHIQAPAIGTAPAIKPLAVGVPIVCALVIVGGNTLPHGDTPLIGLYQFSTLEKTEKHKRETGNQKEDGKRKKAKPRTRQRDLQQKNQKIKEKKKSKEEWQKKTNANKKNKKAEEAYVPLKKKIEGMKKEAFTDKQFDHQVAPGEGLVVVKYLMVDDDVEVRREVNFKAILSEYGGDLLEWKKGDKKDDDVKKDIEEKAKSEEEQPLTMVVVEVQTMGVTKVAKTDMVFFNQEEVVGEAYQVSADQTTVTSDEKQTMEVTKIEDEASQASTDQTTAVSVEEQTIEVVKTKVVIFHQEEDVDEASQLVLMESEVDVTLKKRHALTNAEINERAFKMACRMNQLHAQLDELLPRVLLESFIQRPIS